MNRTASVIIPCLNGAGHLPAVLAALERQTLARDSYEVIVVDNGSTDGSLAIAQRCGVLALSEPDPSAYRARNRGLAAATGAILCFLDADTVPCARWLEVLVAAVRGSDLGLASGRIESRVTRPALGSRLLAWTRSAERRKQAVLASGRLSGGNMAVARTVFERFGPFLPVASGGDGEFAERANPERRPVPFAEAAVVVHACDLSTRAYLRRAYRVARGQAVCGSRSGSGSPCIPWRPGFGRVGGVARALSADGGAPLGPGGIVRLWAVLWMENWCQFFGWRAGRRTRRKEAR